MHRSLLSELEKLLLNVTINRPLLPEPKNFSFPRRNTKQSRSLCSSSRFLRVISWAKTISPSPLGWSFRLCAGFDDQFGQQVYGLVEREKVGDVNRSASAGVAFIQRSAFFR